MTDLNGKAALATLVIDVTLDDGRTERALVYNTDFLRWDRTAAKHGWPRFQDAGVMHTTFLCWSALKRTGQIPAEWTWEDFSETHCLRIRPIEDAETPEQIDPFQMAAVDA